MNRLKKFSRSKSLKNLILASMLALSMNGVYSAELAPVPKVAEDHPQGTLDKLAGQDIPGTDPVQKYPSSGSAYTLTKVQEGGEKPSGDNIVTKFIYNSETKKMTPVYYRMDLKKTQYGTGNGNTISYNWEKNSDGSYTLKESQSLNGSNSIKYSYDSSKSLSRLENPTGDVNGNFIKLSSENFSFNVYEINKNTSPRVSPSVLTAPA